MAVVGTKVGVKVGTFEENKVGAMDGAIVGNLVGRAEGTRVVLK